MPSYILSIAALVAIAQAITVTAPAKDALWDSSKSNTISWTSVSSDPTTVDIYLAHMAAHPPLNDLLFSDVDVSKGSIDVSGLQLPTGETFQINLVAPNKPEQIYAQSQQFNVTGEAVESATSTLSGYTGPAATAGSAATKSGESSGTPTANSESASTTGSTTMATSVSGSTASPTSEGSSSSGSPSESGSGAVSESGSATGASATPSPTANAAAGIAVSTPLAAVFLAFFAIFV